MTPRIVSLALYTSKWSYYVICSILEQPCFISEQLYCSGREIHRAHSRRVAPASTVPCVDSLAAINVETFNFRKHVPSFNTDYVSCTFKLCYYVLHTAEWKLQTLQTTCVLNVFNTHHLLTMWPKHVMWFTMRYRHKMCLIMCSSHKMCHTMCYTRNICA